MTGFRGVLIGALTLIAVQTMVSTSGAAGRTAGLLHTVATFVDNFTNPNQPFFQDHSKPHDDANTSNAVYHDPRTQPVPKTAPTPTPLPPGTHQTGPTYNT
jgi:hypothetical protein